MLSKNTARSALLALACTLGACTPALAQTCNGMGDYFCPARDPVTPIQDGYNPAAVNWNAFVADVYAMTDAEPRLCTMAVRAWFHDGGAHQGELRGQPVDELFPGVGGQDGSIITHDDEAEMEQNAHHGFVRIVRHVLVQLAATHGTSHADALTIFAAMCPRRLQSTVDLPSHCDARGFPLYVGKADYVRPDNLTAYPVHVSRTNQLSQPHTRIPNMYKSLIKDINEQIPDVRWHMDQRDATALIGAHGNMFTQNCMTDAGMPASDEKPDMTDRTCMGDGGSQRMFKWGNHYWQDVRSGMCSQIAPEEGGRKLNPEEDSEFTTCAWNSMEGFALSERMECSAFNDATKTIADKGVNTLEHEMRIGVFADGWREAKWTPDPEQPPAPCCGYTCQSCEEAPGAFWCGELVLNRDRYWPYGYFDCDWNLAYRMGSDYCRAGENFSELCQTSWRGDEGRIEGFMDLVKPLVDEYASSVTTWQEDYAVAFCKFANFGANYTMMTAFTEVYTGATVGCVNPAEVLSPKGCAECQIAGREPGDFVGKMPPVNTATVEATESPPPVETTFLPEETVPPPVETTFLPVETVPPPVETTFRPSSPTTFRPSSPPPPPTGGSFQEQTTEPLNFGAKQDEPTPSPTKKSCGSLCAWMNYWSSLSGRRL